MDVFHRNRRWRVKCLCDCGKITEVQESVFALGKTKSCGCLHREVTRTQKGYASSRTYITWVNMKLRCLNKKATSYPRYGGIGITIDPTWLDFQTFLKDMGERPEEKELDRIDNSKGYFKENCQWITRSKNCAKRGLRSDAKSGLKGVKKTKSGKYMAVFALKSVGTFACPAMASVAHHIAHINKYGVL